MRGAVASGPPRRLDADAGRESIGMASLSDSGGGSCLESSLYLIPSERGKGYGTEAVRRRAAYAFDFLDQEVLQTTTDQENGAARSGEGQLPADGLAAPLYASRGPLARPGRVCADAGMVGGGAPATEEAAGAHKGCPYGSAVGVGEHRVDHQGGVALFVAPHVGQEHDDQAALGVDDQAGARCAAVAKTGR